MEPHYDCLIVGSRAWRRQAAIALRQGKFSGTIGLLGDEKELPYERPPLSKEYLAGEKPFERIMIRLAGGLAHAQCALLPGHRVEASRADAHVVVCDDGASFSYTLCLGGGGAARNLDLPRSRLKGVHRVRTAPISMRSARASRRPAHRRVGGGYIGLEAAAVLRKRASR